MKTYWISFANDFGCLGVCLIDARNVKEALNKVSQLGLNPGGEAALYEMPINNPEAAQEVSDMGKNRLISQEELMSKKYRKVKDLPEEIQDDFLSGKFSIVHEECNETNKAKRLN